MRTVEIEGVLSDASDPPIGIEPWEPTVQTITWQQGTDGRVVVTVLNSGGDAVDLTDCELVLSVRRRTIDAEATFARSAVVADPETGVAEFSIMAADTSTLAIARYRYDVQLVDADNNRSQVVPVSFFDLVAVAGRADDTVTP